MRERGQTGRVVPDRLHVKCMMRGDSELRGAGDTTRSPLEVCPVQGRRTGVVVSQQPRQEDGMESVHAVFAEPDDLSHARLAELKVQEPAVLSGSHLHAPAQGNTAQEDGDASAIGAGSPSPVGSGGTHSARSSDMDLCGSSLVDREEQEDESEVRGAPSVLPNRMFTADNGNPCIARFHAMPDLAFAQKLSSGARSSPMKIFGFCEMTARPEDGSADVSSMRSSVPRTASFKAGTASRESAASSSILSSTASTSTPASPLESDFDWDSPSSKVKRERVCDSVSVSLIDRPAQDSDADSDETNVDWLGEHARNWGALGAAFAGSRPFSKKSKEEMKERKLEEGEIMFSQISSAVKAELGRQVKDHLLLHVAPMIRSELMQFVMERGPMVLTEKTIQIKHRMMEQKRRETEELERNRQQNFFEARSSWKADNEVDPLLSENKRRIPECIPHDSPFNTSLVGARGLALPALESDEAEQHEYVTSSGGTASIDGSSFRGDTERYSVASSMINTPQVASCSNTGTAEPSSPGRVEDQDQEIDRGAKARQSVEDALEAELDEIEKSEEGHGLDQDQGAEWDGEGGQVPEMQMHDDPPIEATPGDCDPDLLDKISPASSVVSCDVGRLDDEGSKRGKISPDATTEGTREGYWEKNPQGKRLWVPASDKQGGSEGKGRVKRVSILRKKPQEKHASGKKQKKVKAVKMQAVPGKRKGETNRAQRKRWSAVEEGGGRVVAGTRCSKRKRFRVLEFWRNERVEVLL